MLRSHGFTLMELMITVVIVGILLMVAVPSFQTTIANNKVQTQANAFLGALSYAKSEAIRRATNVKLCISNSAKTACDSAAGANWKNGWLAVISTSSEVLRVWEGASGMSNDTGADTVKLIEYKANGMRDSATVDAVFTFTISGCAGDNKRTLTIKRTGRATTAFSACP